MTEINTVDMGEVEFEFRVGTLLLVLSGIFMFLWFRCNDLNQ